MGGPHPLQDGPGAATVQDALDSRDAVMSWINLGEVDYIVRYRLGSEAADDVRASVDVRVPDVSLIRSAARIKAAVPMAYADAFAAATSARIKAPVLTGDPELMIRAGHTEVVSWTYLDLRSP